MTLMASEIPLKRRQHIFFISAQCRKRERHNLGIEIIISVQLGLSQIRRQPSPIKGKRVGFSKTTNKEKVSMKDQIIATIKEVSREKEDKAMDDT